ncbi:type IV pilin [Halorubrum sp. Hd13]|uniref:type IV pilin n=1 Tax=Halorubrum sp. Hd13 TaxID=1480728 RepID=UPI000B98ED86|nr:type IV pilin N-terminal domain-containing protein [Halorubrum sp. Hd13]OYR40852.1 hypothetical protein DJ81_13315 [Halorubrum sp. Hd13]
MKPSNLFNSDDRAVSPVIGVILMVAITVILAAVIGTFVLGLGDSLGDSQPTAQIDVDVKNATAGSTFNVTLEHSGGDRIDSESLRVIVSDTSGNEATASDEFTDAFTVGDIETGSFSVSEASGSENIRVRVIHQPSDSILVDRTIEADGLSAVSGGSFSF